MLLAPPRGRGRPSSMTAEARTRFLEALRAGNTIQDSAEFASRDYSTIRRWILRDCEPKTKARKEYREFRVALSIATVQVPSSLRLRETCAADGFRSVQHPPGLDTRFQQVSHQTLAAGVCQPVAIPD
jgi:hypothetical protein